jgi:hypothetical protein
MTVGIELTQLRFSPDDRHLRSLFEPESHDPDAFWRLLELLHNKEQTLTKGRWSECQRKILVIMLVDTTIEAMAGDTDPPTEGGFDEIWLADYTQAEVFGAVDLFALVHAELEGHFATGDQGQKPYG